VQEPTTVSRWHEIVRTGDEARLDAILAEDAVFHSPVVHAPQQGKALTKMYLMAAFQVFLNGTFIYVREIVDKRDAALEFEATVDGVHINGIDLIRWNDEGKIVDFKVMIRPRKAIQLLQERMAAMLETMK
jgi:hypothetical protein